MPVRVDFHPEFDAWFQTLGEVQQDRIAAYLKLLAEQGVTLRDPYSKKLKGSTRIHELRPSIKRHEYRLLYAFTPDRSAVVLLGGDKTGDWDKWYDVNLPIAEERLRAFETP